MNYPKERYTGAKPWMDYDWLYEQYITLDKRSQDIADEYGIKQSTLQAWLLKHKIKKKITKHHRKPQHQYENRDYLYEQHIVLHKSMAEIARENDVSGDTIRHHLQKCGIEPWQSRPKTKLTDEEIDEVVHLYTDDGVSANEIAKRFGSDHNTIINHLKRRGVHTRSCSESQFALNNKEVPELLLDTQALNTMHWENGMSCVDIGKMLDVDAGTVRRAMQRLGLKTKTNAESKIGLMTGDKHPNWHGGITQLDYLLREFFHVNQAPVIAARDNYTCQLCGAQHVVLHVHHIRSFSSIVSEICSEHPDLHPDDPVEKLQLYDIITHDNRFLDSNNLITYCKDCHQQKIHKRKTISSQASLEEGSETIRQPEYAVSD